MEEYSKSRPVSAKRRVNFEGKLGDCEDGLADQREKAWELEGWTDDPSVVRNSLHSRFPLGMAGACDLEFLKFVISG